MFLIDSTMVTNVYSIYTRGYKNDLLFFLNTVTTCFILKENKVKHIEIKSNNLMIICLFYSHGHLTEYIKRTPH